MFPRQPVTHKHLPQVMESKAASVFLCVCVCLCVYAAWQSTECTPTSAVNLALTLEQPGHVASPLSAGTANTQTHTLALCHPLSRSCWWTHGALLPGRSHISITPSPLFHSLLPRLLSATQSAHLTSSGGLFSAFFFFSFLLKSLLLLRLKTGSGPEVIKQNKMETLPRPPPNRKKTKKREETEALIAAHPYNHIPLLEYCSYLMPFVVSVDKH